MIKRLFVEILPLSPDGDSFHEMSVIVEVNNEIKAAYHYKLKIDNQNFQLETLEKQGYLLSEIKENPQNFYEAYGSVLKLLETYVNAFDDKDFLLLYVWNKRTSSIFYKFLYNNGIRNLDQYLYKFPILVSNLILDMYPNLLDNNKGISLDYFNEELGYKSIEKDALSRNIAIYRLYKSLDGVRSKNSTEI